MSQSFWPSQLLPRQCFIRLPAVARCRRRVFQLAAPADDCPRLDLVDVITRIPVLERRPWPAPSVFKPSFVTQTQSKSCHFSMENPSKSCKARARDNLGMDLICQNRPKRSKLTKLLRRCPAVPGDFHPVVRERLEALRTSATAGGSSDSPPHLDQPIESCRQFPAQQSVSPKKRSKLAVNGSDVDQNGGQVAPYFAHALGRYGRCEWSYRFVTAPRQV